MKRSSFSFFLFTLLVAGQIGAQTSDPTLLTINGKPITRSEFEYSFNKNNEAGTGLEQKTLAEYLELFINYKLKVCEAETLQLDTLLSFKDEFRSYRDMLVLPYLVDTVYVDSVARMFYGSILENLGGKDLIQVAHIFVRVPQRATGAEQAQARQKADSLYALVKQGTDFGELAEKTSEDLASAQNKGLLPWIGPGSTLKEFEDVAYALQPNEVSKPFLSTAGYHIVKMIARKPFESYEEKKADIIRYLEQQGINEQASENKIARLLADSDGHLTREDIIVSEKERIEAEHPAVKYLIKEYYDGLLLYEVSNAQVWDKAAKDIAGLQTYFRNNLSRYTWNAPRFKGFVLQASDKKQLAELKKFVRKASLATWWKEYQTTFAGDTLRPTVANYGLFVPGENALADKLIFRTKEVDKSAPTLPFATTVGKKLKKPDSYEDVHSAVLSDYQDHLEKEWVASLRRKYQTEVNQDVFTTVNHHQ